MDEVTTDTVNALIRVVVTVSEKEQVTRLLGAVQEAAESLAGRPIKCLADLRQAGVVSPEVVEILKDHQRTMSRLGVMQTAEVVVNSLVALQLNRVAREAGVDDRIRRFATYDEAQDWLLRGDAASST